MPTQWAEPNAFMPGVCLAAAFLAVVLPVGRGEAAALGLVAAQLVFALVVEPRYQPIQDRGLAGLKDSYKIQELGRTLPPADLRARAWALREELERTPGPILALQFALGVYGGYFGGAVGLMMMAAWSLLAGVDLKQLNPPRTLMVSAANTVAVVCFAIAGAVRWPQALMVALGALAGGYLGAHLGRRLDPRVVRAATIALSVAMTAVFFVRAARG